MSSKAQNASVVIEWSPGAVSAYDSASGRTFKGSTLAQIAQQVGAKEAVFAVGRRACFVRSVNVPDAPKEDLVQALSMSISQYVPIGTGDACVDLRLIGNPGPEGRTATLVAMRASDLRELQDEAKNAGIRIIATVPAAYGSWLLANGTSIPDCAAVSEGAEGMGVDLISGGELKYSRALPPNSYNGRLAPELARTFSAAGLKTAPILAQGVDVSAAQYHVAKSPLEALSGIGWATPGVSFELPEVVQARAKSATSKRARLAVLLCLGALLMVALVYTDRSDAQAKVDRAQARANKAVSDLRGKRDQILAQANDASATAATLNRGFSPSQHLSDVVALVSNDLPKTAWLTNISVSRGQEITMRGTAMTGLDVKTYLDALNKEKRLRDVHLVFANNALIESTPVVQYSITAFPVGNLPLVEKQPNKGVKR